MAAADQRVLDHRRLESEVAGFRVETANASPALVRAFLGSWLSALVLFFVVLDLLEGHLPAFAGMTQRKLIVRTIGSLLMGGLSTLSTWWVIRRARNESAAARAVRLEEAWVGLVGPNWLWRTLRMGVLITAGVGIPVGLLIAFGPPLDHFADPRPLAKLSHFLGLTALWAFPMAMVIRWISLRSLRRYLRPPP